MKLLNMLIVEDDETTSRIMRDVLEEAYPHLSYQVTTNNHRACKAIIHSRFNPYDFAIIDPGIPGGTGRLQDDGGMDTFKFMLEYGTPQDIVFYSGSKLEETRERLLRPSRGLKELQKDDRVSDGTTYSAVTIISNETKRVMEVGLFKKSGDIVRDMRIVIAYLSNKRDTRLRAQFNNRVAELPSKLALS